MKYDDPREPLVRKEVQSGQLLPTRPPIPLRSVVRTEQSVCYP